jgi:transposase-like protein/transposase Tn5 family protein
MELDFTDELGYLDLGDKRRNARFVKIVTAMTNRPSSSIPAANTNWYDVKATYEFFKSPNVRETDIAAAIYRSTRERCLREETVLVIQDTTNISFDSRAPDLGYLDHGRGNGLMMHHALCVSTGGKPLGTIDHHIWARDRDGMGKKATRGSRAIGDKESHRWIAALKRSQLLLDGCRQVVTIADREADIYELFTEARPAGSGLLIRATHNRKSVFGDSIWDEVGATPAVATIRMDVQKPKGGTRTALLEVRHGIVVADPTKRDLPAVLLTGITVTEPSPPVGTEPLEWKLLTDTVVGSTEDAVRCVGWYGLRWQVERFHFTLKSGCGVEQLQLRSAVQLRKALVVYAYVAFRLMWILYESRENPGQPCTAIFQEHEWLSLHSHCHRTPEPPEQAPSLREMVYMIGRLGGFIGRKSDGQPGIKNLWRGMVRLRDIADTYLALTSGSYKQNSRFG